MSGCAASLGGRQIGRHRSDVQGAKEVGTYDNIDGQEQMRDTPGELPLPASCRREAKDQQRGSAASSSTARRARRVWRVWRMTHDWRYQSWSPN